MRVDRWIFLVTAALPLPAFAQEPAAQESAGDPAQPASPARPSTGKQSAADYGTGDIIVTATRQAQFISKVPISVSAFSQQSMDVKGMKSFSEVARFTPGVNFSAGGNQISIRGISSDAGSGTTGIYIDDTPIQMRNLGFNADNSAPAIFDLDRVEVLRGPQGTLFGAGSEGGTVRYITPQPSLTTFSTYDRAEISSTDKGGISYEIGSAVGLPIITDKLGVRLSAWHRRDGGYIDHVDYKTNQVDDKNINHGDVTVLRGALAWQPISGLLITPSVLWQKRTTNMTDSFFPAISNIKRGAFRNGSPEYRGSNDRYILPTLNIRYDTDSISFISNSSYFKRTNRTGYDGTIYNLSYYQDCYATGCGFQDEGVPGQAFFPFLTPTGVNPDLPRYLSPSRITNTQKIWTQEIRLQSADPDARFKWVVGAFYQHSAQRSVEELVDPQGNDFFNAVFGQSLEDFFGYPLFGKDSYITNTKGKDSQIAGFVDLTYELLPGLKISGGVRVARTKFSFVNFADGSQNGERTEGAGNASETPVTPKAGVNWQIDPNNLLYATWAKGFRPGGANAPVPVNACASDLEELGLKSSPDTYKSDTVSSFEIGSKNKLFDNKLQIAASVYQVKWKGIQQNVFLNSCGIQFTGNLGSARSRGFDLQMTLTPVRGVSIDASVGYTHTAYTQTLVFGSSRPVISDGNAIEGPPWTFSLGGQYDFPIGAHDFYIRGDLSYQSRLNRPTQSLDPRNQSYDPALVADDARTQLTLRAGAIIDGFNISVFADNLLNATPRINYNHQNVDTLLFTQRTLRPRTIGLTIAYRH